MGEEFVSIVKGLYRDAVPCYKTSAGVSTPRVATTGVKQGDLLSGVLFIIAIDFLLRCIQREGSCRDRAIETCFIIYSHMRRYAGNGEGRRDPAGLFDTP